MLVVILENSPPTRRSSRRGRRTARVTAATVGGLGLLALLGLVSLAVGSKDLTLAEAWRGLLAHDGSRESIIVWKLRMPRTALAIAVGAALAVAGVLMQGLTRNPLAEPGLLGVNAGAALAVVVGISVFGVVGVSYMWFAFLGAAAAASFVYLLGMRRTRPGDNARLVLAGAALTACLASITGTITMFDSRTFDSYRFWVIGSVAERGTEPLVQVLPFLIVGLAVAFTAGPALNVLALGDEQAAALGARLALVRGSVLLAITLLCGAATAAAGPIGFVGLVVPHVLRIVAGAEQRALLVLSAVVGPVLVLAADILGRVVARPSELEVGIVTAFVGAPFLLALLMTRRVR